MSSNLANIAVFSLEYANVLWDLSYTVPENGATFVIIKLYVRIVNNEEVTVLLNTVHIT